MAERKQILVKTPLTENGRDIIMGEDGKQVFIESILLDVPGEHGARRILEKRNQTLPKVLQCIITDYTPPVEETLATTPQVTALDMLKIQAENEKLKQQLAEMQQPAAKPEKPVPQKPNVTQ